jgi:nicotinamide-nucleotide amidase
LNAEIVAIGSELLLGQIVDTNSAWMAQRLAGLGVNLFYKTVVGDNPQRMLEITNRAMDRSDLVITSGGLGPTQDDLTREVVAQASNRDLVMDPTLLQEIEERFRRRGFIMTENNNRQAFIPEGATPVTNPNGTAPSFIVEDPRAVIYCLPGVPFEMKWLFDNELAPYIRGRFGLSDAIYSRVLKVSDIGESGVDDLMGHLIADSVNPTVGVLAHPGQVDVRITAKATNQSVAEELIAPLETEVRELLKGHIFGVDEETMPQVLGNLLKLRGLTVASYEGLTGGIIAQQLQDASGELFLQGVIGCQPNVFHSLLSASIEGLSFDELMCDGAAMADGMAAGIRSQTGASLGLAVHSVPDVGKQMENLNSGRTYISVACATGTFRREYNFAGSGTPDRTRAGMNALDLLRVTVLGL